MEVWVKYKKGEQQAEIKKIHYSLRRKYGTATKCENEDCKYPNPKRFEWALKKEHSYSVNKEDYTQLCPSCHRKYDLTPEARQKYRESHLGERQVTSKLKEADVLLILSLIKDGLENKEIARRFKVDPSTISDIKRGKNWSYLTKIKRHEQFRKMD